MKQFKEHHLYIPGIAILMLLISKWLSMSGMAWYHTLRLPWYTPPTWAFPVIWNIIYFLTVIAAITFWNKAKNGKDVKWLFALNALLNILWTYAFFYEQSIGIALLIAVLLACTIVLLMLLMWPVSPISVLLLIPYLLWVALAVCLNYGVWMLN